MIKTERERTNDLLGTLSFMIKWTKLFTSGRIKREGRALAWESGIARIISAGCILCRE